MLLSLLLFACKSKLNETKKSEIPNSNQIDFCTECDSLDTWIGSIQGVKNSDSTGIFPFAECHTNHSYDLIWIPKGDLIGFIRSMSSDSLYHYYQISGNNPNKEMICYAFVLPKSRRIPDEDLSEFNYIFPCEVDIYKKTEGKWSKLHSKKIKTFEELGRLKLNTIFEID